MIPVEMMYDFFGYLHASVSVVFYSFGAGHYLSISLRVQWDVCLNICFACHSGGLRCKADIFTEFRPEHKIALSSYVIYKVG